MRKKRAGSSSDTFSRQIAQNKYDGSEWFTDLISGWLFILLLQGHLIEFFIARISALLSYTALINTPERWQSLQIVAFALSRLRSLLARCNPVLIIAERSVIGFPLGWILRQTRSSSLRRLEEAILKYTLRTLESDADDTQRHLCRREVCSMMG